LKLFFLDASALVKRYSKESGSVLVNEMFRHIPTTEMTCSTIGVLEIVSILVRKRNDGRLSEELFDQAMTNFKAEVIDSKSFLITSVNDFLILSALGLVAKYNLNATDAVILRSAMDIFKELEASEDQLVLWTSDRRLARAAETEGIATFDPEAETMDNLHKLLGVQ
jgi:predicted nucleic acid-binding protein